LSSQQLTSKNRHKQIQTILTGLVAGMAMSLFGVGGGIFFVPAFHLVYGFSLKKSIGTGLACVGLTALTGLLGHLHMMGQFPIQKTVVLLLVASIFAQVGVMFLRRMESGSIKWIYISFLLLVAVKIAFFDVEPSHLATWPSLTVFILIGVVTGLLNGILGIGGGIIVVGTLAGFFQIPLAKAVAVSLATILVTSGSSVIGHAKHDHVVWRAVLPMTVPAIFGTQLGSYFAHRLPERFTEILLSAFLFFMAFRIWKRDQKDHVINPLSERCEKDQTA